MVLSIDKPKYRFLSLLESAVAVIFLFVCFCLRLFNVKLSKFLDLDIFFEALIFKCQS